jgi:predicted transcriptional regulator
MAEATVRSVSVRVDRGTYDRVRRLAAEDDRSITEVIAAAVKEAEERRFWRAYQEGLARLKADPKAWAGWVEESRELEGTLGDGIEPDEDWTWLKEAADSGQLELREPRDRE